MIPPGPRDALIVIDVQNDFCPGGALAVPEGDAVVPVINRLVASFALIVLTQDWHPPGHRSFASAHPALDTRAAQLVVRKGFRREIDSYSAFFENDRATPTGLRGYLGERGLSRVFLAGLATDYCVFYSALDARRIGLDVVVVTDACRAIDLDGSRDRALAGMTAAGVKLATSDAIPRW